MWAHLDCDIIRRRYFYGIVSVYFCKTLHRLNPLRSDLTDKRQEVRAVDDRKIFAKLRNKQIIGSCLLIGTLVGGILFVTYEALTLHKKLQTTDNAHETERHGGFTNLQPKPLVNLDNSFTKDLNDFVTQAVERIKKGLIPWAQSKTKDPALLLSLVESEDADVRRWGMNALISNNDWEDYQYRMVSQGCSNRTLVSLARLPHSNNKFFRQLPWLPPSTETKERCLQNLLAELQRDVTDSGIKQFTGKVLSEGSPKTIVESGLWNFGDSLLQYENLQMDDKNKSELIYLLQALVSHTSSPTQCSKILEYGGLMLLHRIYLQYPDNIDVYRLIAWIIANLSVDVSLHKSIIDGGWVTILHQWLYSSDTAVSFHTARALANLDRDFEPGYDIEAIYEEGIYLAHPVNKTLSRKKRVKADIVFIHGLMGGPFKTWRQKDRDTKHFDVNVQDHTYFWPKSGKHCGRRSHYSLRAMASFATTFSKVVCFRCGETRYYEDWLSKDVPHVRILNVGYQTELTTWDTNHPVEPGRRTLYNRSSDLLEKLQKADIGNRPVILVGHSMGGLLIKEMLRIAASDSRYSSVVENTIGVLFYSVPHHGSSLAKISNQAKYMVFPSVEVQELDKDNASLKELHKSFLDLHKTCDFPVLSFGETEKTRIRMNMKALFVPPESSDPGCGEFHTVPTDHISVCKPQDTDSDLYQRSLSFIRKCLFHSSLKQTVAKAKQTLDISSDS